MAALTEVAWSRWLRAALPVAAVRWAVAGTRRAARVRPVLASAHKPPLSPLSRLDTMENTFPANTITTINDSNDVNYIGASLRVAYAIEATIQSGRT